MNSVDTVLALAASQAEAVSQFWQAVGAGAAVLVFLVVFCIGVFPAVSRAYRRFRAACREKPVQTAILVALSLPLIHYGATKFVPPVTEVAAEVTASGVAFEWDMPGHRDTTQYVIYRLEEAEPGVTNTVQHAIVTGERSYVDAFPNADRCDWRIQYLPPVVVEGDEIEITEFEVPEGGGLRMAWRVKDKVVAGVDVFDVKRRHRVIPSRTGWSAWETVQSSTATEYVDTAFHYFQDEEWKVECTKEDDQ